MLRNIGKFSIPRFLIDTSPEEVALALSVMVVLRAEMQYHTDSIEYVAHCPEHFAEVAEGSLTPSYVAIFNKIELEDGETRSFVSGWEPV